METFHLTRNEMATLLLSLRGWNTKKPLGILQEAWAKSHKKILKADKALLLLLLPHFHLFSKTN